MLSVRALAKRYAAPRERIVLAHVDLDVRAGDYIAIMGESGVGKSTLLNLIAGLDRPDEGSIRLDDVDLASLDDDALTRLRRERMGFVFQAFHVLPYLTVAQNVALPLSLLGVAAAEAEQRVSRRCSPPSGWPIGTRACRASFPAASCSASRSRARSCIGPRSCSPTSRPAISIRKARPRSSTLLRAQVKEHGAAALLVTHSARRGAHGRPRARADARRAA